MRITLEVIPHEQQRLGAIGDWFFEKNGDLVVHVSDLGDWRYNFLVLRHEMDEAMLCMKDGITTETVDIEQVAHQEDVKAMGGIDMDDPDSFSGYPGSSIQVQHDDALAAEWVMSRLLGVDWVEYGKAAEKVGGF